MATDETKNTPPEAEKTQASVSPTQPAEQVVSQPVSLDDITSGVEEKKPADPFARLKKKKVAMPQALRDSSGVTGGKVKAGTKMSPRIFLIGCLFFFFLFLGLVYAGLYYAITSSDFLQGLGLEIENVKQILMIFAVLFFGLLFFLGFYILILNIYRLVTVKGKKIRYVLGLVLGFIIIISTIVFGTISIQQIRALSGKSKINTDQIVMPFLQTKNSLVRVNEGIPLIAPMKMRYQINKDQFDRNVLPIIGGNPITGFELDCGNGQILKGGPQIHLGLTNSYFDDHCLYLQKSTYPLNLKVFYNNRATGEAQNQQFFLGDLTVNAAIQLIPTEDEAYLNDTKNEYILGVAPVNVDFKAQLLFTDLGLREDRIQRDMDGDGAVDIENNASFQFPFGQSKLHTIAYRLPEITKFADTRFAFDVRVVESELARCTLRVDSIDNDKRFKLTPQFDELIDAETFQYTIYDVSQDTIVETKKENQPSLTYAFQKGGTYEIQVRYFTPEGEKGSCAPMPLTVGFVGNKVTFEMKYRQDELNPFVRVTEVTPVTVDTVNSVINVNLLPAILEISVTDVQPDPNADVKLFYDGKQVFADRDDVFEVNIGTLGTKELKFVITTLQEKQDEQIYTVNINRQPVKAMMLVEPDVGEDPLEVVLDASVSPLYNEEDEIVYFTRDFGDGETRQNISQGKVTHTYKYDYEKDTGEFFPVVTVKTKLGHTDTFRLPTPIIVKKKQRAVKVSVDSHPTQQARIGEIVTFSVETDGQVQHIDRNFGNYKTLGCDGRTCATAPVTYDQAGEYEVRVEVQYENDVPVVGRIKIRIY